MGACALMSKTYTVQMEDQWVIADATLIATNPTVTYTLVLRSRPSWWRRLLRLVRRV